MTENSERGRGQWEGEGGRRTSPLRLGLTGVEAIEIQALNISFMCKFMVFRDGRSCGRQTEESRKGKSATPPCPDRPSPGLIFGLVRD